MEIIDLKCTIIEGYPIVRIDTDEGVSGFAQIEFPKRNELAAIRKRLP